MCKYKVINFFSRHTIIGVVSAGNGCAHQDYPGIYTRITEFKNWIQAVASESFCSNCEKGIPKEGKKKYIFFVRLSNVIKTYFFSALIVTGGRNGLQVLTTVEIVTEDGNSCSLPDFPNPGRFGHTQSAFTSCGGSGETKNCMTFTDGKWVTSHNLVTWRNYHTSWMSKYGIFLIGGNWPASTSAELLSAYSSSSTESFSLPYETE